ncbi:MAG: alpha/beta hydrolase [Planctomycetaceae bacterium]|nr:alpha/beta hydrolase [Planctomycetaceae bacterium]
MSGLWQTGMAGRRVATVILALVAAAACVQRVAANDDGLAVWPNRAPGETSDSTGVTAPNRPNEIPPVTRVTKIRRPTIDVFPARRPNGTAILVLPGGGFSKVVPDKEGSEAAPWLNELGISVFVLRYRTNEVTPRTEAAWKRPLQDAQRALRLIRARAEEWKIQPDRVGVLGFSAGGQVASILHTAKGRAAYDAVDQIDQQNAAPDFSLLIYPWNVLQKGTQTLLPEIAVDGDSPPAFVVHTHDDRSSSVGAVLIYAALRQHNVPAELHVYANGGHGYGMRPVAGSEIGTWPDRATAWLKLRKLAD